jgi:membrane-associated phospholipid phosphatase
VESLLITISYNIYFISGWGIIGGICILVALYLLKKKELTQLKIFVLALFLTAVLTLLIKDLTKVERPANALIGLDSYAFPSGHTSIIFCFLTFLINYILKSARSRFAKIFSISIFSIIALSIPASRLILGIHTIFQIIAGAILGTAITLWIIKKFKK